MTQPTQPHKIILALAGAIGGSMLMGLPVLSEMTNSNSSNTRTPDVYRDHTSPADPNSPLYQQSGDGDRTLLDRRNSFEYNRPADRANSSDGDRMSQDNPNSSVYHFSGNDQSGKKGSERPLNNENENSQGYRVTH